MMRLVIESPWAHHGSLSGWAARCFAGAPSAGPRLCFAGAGAVGAGAGRDRDLRVLDRSETATISAVKTMKLIETGQFIGSSSGNRSLGTPELCTVQDCFWMFFLRCPFGWGTGSGCPGGPIAQGDRDRSRHCRGGHQWRQCRSLWSLGLDLLSCRDHLFVDQHYIAFYTISRHITQYYTILYNTICTTDQLVWNLYCHECSTWREKVDRN